MYANKKELKRKLSLHAIKNNFEFKMKKFGKRCFGVGYVGSTKHGKSVHRQCQELTSGRSEYMYHLTHTI